MGDIVAVTVNGDLTLRYERSRALAPRQREYLDRMDERMTRGVELEGKMITNPDRLQRAQFVAMELLSAMTAEDEPRVAAMLSYLAERLADLEQIKVELRDDEATVDLVFDQSYVPQQVIRFVPREPGGGATRH